MSEWPELRINISRLLDRHNLAEVKQRPASANRLEVAATVVASRLAISSAQIPEDSPIAVEGQIEAGLSSLDFDATISGTWVAECRRCLEPVEGDLKVDVRSSFVLVADESEADVDTYPIDGDWIDVGEVVRDELMLALPLTALCRELCEGADPERFPTVAPETSPGSEVDSRWDALSQLTFDED